MNKLPLVLEKPTLPHHLPDSSCWLAGEGAGSWFVFESIAENQSYVIARYTPKGQLECRGIFQSDVQIDLTQGFELDYPSHCQTITVVQKGRKIRCNRIR